MSRYNKRKKSKILKETRTMKLVRIDARTEVEVPIDMPDELARKRYWFHHQRDEQQSPSTTLFEDKELIF